MSYLKRLTNAALGRLQAFRMYGGIGMSASSLHRESTDSDILGAYCHHCREDLETVYMQWKSFHNTMFVCTVCHLLPWVLPKNNVYTDIIFCTCSSPQSYSRTNSQTNT